MRVAVPILDGVFDSGLSAVLDVLDMANALSPRPPFEVLRLGLRKSVVTAQGARLSVQPLPAAGSFAHVVVPALGVKDAPGLQARLARPDVAALVAWLPRQRRAHFHAACTGTWVLGRAGLLDGREATTSWWFAPEFAQAFPAVKLDARRLLVRAGPVTTGGAAFAHVDLMLALVAGVSPSLAALVADRLAMESRTSQAPFLVAHPVQSDDALVRRFEDFVRERLARPFALRRAARAVGASQRTLQRRLQQTLGTSPIQFVQRVRLQHAVHLLQHTQQPVEAIAEQVGYQSGHTLRVLLRRELGVGVKALRAAPGAA
jgi:transcriptional regulator GlxA family with amidase domain